MEETTIIKAVLKGETERYEQLVNRYHVGLIIHCERLVNDRQTAEDIAQEAFIKAYEQLSEFDDSKGRFSTWLYKIATHKALDYLRAAKHVLPSEDINELADAAVPDYDSEEQKRVVRHAVETLEPPAYRQVIEAYYWEGKSYEQIARAVDKPINTVRTWLRRAKEQLRSDLS